MVSLFNTAPYVSIWNVKNDLNLKKQLALWKKKNISYPDSTILNKLNSLKLLIKAEFALSCTKQNYYEGGKKSGKYLAHRVKQFSTQNLIPSIFDDKDKLITDGKEIYKVFTKFYKEL